MMGDATSAYKDYIAGLAAGVSTVITGHPFDTVKVKLQKHNTEVHGIKYRNALHCTGRILKNEGVRGLYRGATSSFIGVAFESSLLFGIYSQTKQSLQDRGFSIAKWNVNVLVTGRISTEATGTLLLAMRDIGEVNSSKPQLQVIVPSAAFGGAIISFILCPSELVKCRMQVQGTDSMVLKHNRYNGPLDCALKTIKNEGVNGLFHGGFTTLLRESVGNAVFFSTYEYVRYYMQLQLNPPLSGSSNQPNALIDVGVGIMSGGIAGVAFWSAILPLDVAKTIIQTAPDTQSSRNPFQTLQSIYRKTGTRGCYAGLGPTLVRAFPANAAAIVTWELAAKLLGIKRN